jgi:2-polyprenyl-6-methoxyphenol hydroxylase-like FAD-dependent oxidoreductase
MSPVGGVGINLAVQDAVAAANLLAEPLRAGRVTEGDLVAVQRRRERPTRLTQRMQLIMQRNMISPVLEGKASAQLPRPMKALLRLAFLRRLVSRLIAIGFRSEHVQPTTFRASLRA